MPSPRDPCFECYGSGETYRIVNPDWPSDDRPHLENTGDPCSRCGGTGARAFTGGEGPILVQDLRAMLDELSPTAWIMVRHHEAGYDAAATVRCAYVTQHPTTYEGRFVSAEFREGCGAGRIIPTCCDELYRWHACTASWASRSSTPNLEPSPPMVASSRTSLPA